jgi:hypothetical protein
MFDDDTEIEKLKHLPGIKETIESFKGAFKTLSEDYIRVALEKYAKKKKDIEDVSFILFVRAAPDASMALWYAAREASATGLPLEITEVALETRYLNTDVNTLAAISEGSGGMAKSLLATADRVHKEHDLRSWIQHQNDLKGVAPTTALVLKHLAQMHEGKKKRYGTCRLGNAGRPQHQMGATLPPSARSAERSFRPRRALGTAGPRTEGP